METATVSDSNPSHTSKNLDSSKETGFVFSTVWMVVKPLAVMTSRVLSFKDGSVKGEAMSEVVITKEMEAEEKQLMEEGERKEKMMIEKVCVLSQSHPIPI